jgi:hypothetical protein
MLIVIVNPGIFVRQYVLSTIKIIYNGYSYFVRDSVSRALIMTL